MSTMKCVLYYDNVKTEKFFGNDFWHPVTYSSEQHHWNLLKIKMYPKRLLIFDSRVSNQVSY